MVSWHLYPFWVLSSVLSDCPECLPPLQLQVDVKKLENRFKYLCRKQPGHSRHKKADKFVHHHLSASHPATLDLVHTPAPSPITFHELLDPLTDSIPVPPVMTDEEAWNCMKNYLADLPA